VDLGDILVGVGILFAVLDFFIPYDRYPRRNWDGGLLTVGVILIGVGVLCQGTTVGSNS
jgi:hypothetical protein